MYHYYFNGLETGIYQFAVVSPPAMAIAIDISAALRAWESCNRELRDAERYGVAKLALFEALDAAETPGQLPALHVLPPDRMRDIAGQLDF